MEIKFVLNNKQVSIETEPMKRLLDVLREDFELTGVKEGCGEGECGACAVLLNDVLVNSCLVAVGTVAGKNITTIEGLRDTEEFRILEESFTTAGSVQCGFCTPGFIMASVALLRKNPNPNEEEIRSAISGNLCRCTGYNLIVEGIKLASKKGADIW